MKFIILFISIALTMSAAAQTSQVIEGNVIMVKGDTVYLSGGYSFTVSTKKLPMPIVGQYVTFTATKNRHKKNAKKIEDEGAKTATVNQ